MAAEERHKGFDSRNRRPESYHIGNVQSLRKTHSCNTTADPPPRLHTHQWLLQNLPAGGDESVSKKSFQQDQKVIYERQIMSRSLEALGNHPGNKRLISTTGYFF